MAAGRRNENDRQRPAESCDVDCHRGWVECGGIEYDDSHPWVQMCVNCTSSPVLGADDDLAARWAAEDTGLPVGYARAHPCTHAEGEDFLRPYLIGGWLPPVAPVGAASLDRVLRLGGS